MRAGANGPARAMPRAVAAGRATGCWRSCGEKVSEAAPFVPRLPRRCGRAAPGNDSRAWPLCRFGQQEQSELASLRSGGVALSPARPDQPARSGAGRRRHRAIFVADCRRGVRPVNGKVPVCGEARSWRRNACGVDAAGDVRSPGQGIRSRAAFPAFVPAAGWRTWRRASDDRVARGLVAGCMDRISRRAVAMAGACTVPSPAALPTAVATFWYPGRSVCRHRGSDGSRCYSGRPPTDPATCASGSSLLQRSWHLWSSTARQFCRGRR